MKYLQRLGKSLMLPVACLPAAAILMGIGYWIDPTGWGANNVLAAFLLKAGGALIENMAILFAVGVAIGMSDDGDGAAGLAGLVAWLVITTLLSTNAVALFTKTAPEEVPAAFGKIQTQFIGIICGLIGGACYNKFKGTRLPDFLGFFSGRRSVAIVTSAFACIASAILFFLWPPLYNTLMKFGEGITGSGFIGAGIYGFFNRLLIPFGLHHALNSVFWFDVAGISDIGKFWGSVEGGIIGTTGLYMTGFFPVMMFGLPAAALAMYNTAFKKRKEAVVGLLFSAAVASFFTGVTEPLEFSFMFLAPVLYLIHAILTGLSLAICTLLPVRCGFNFSAGFVDWILSFKAPMAVNPWLIIPIGIVCGIIYYVIFRLMIVSFNLKTPGREDETDIDETKVTLANDDFTEIASIILKGLGGKENIINASNCATRLRVEINDSDLVDEAIIKSSGVPGVIKAGKKNVQVIIGTNVQFVTDEFKKLCK